MEQIEFEVVNWEKFNPRKDIKHPTWFALSNRFLDDPKFFGFKGDHFKAVIYLFSQASQNASAKAVAFLDHAEETYKIPREVLRETIKTLVERDVLRASLPKTKARTRTSRPRTNPSRDRQTLQTDTTDTTLAVRTDAPVVSENPVTFYCDEYRARYGHNPPIAPKQAGILTKFAKDHPGNWQEYIRGYLAMPDTWSVARSHPAELLSTKLNEIVRFIKTGKVVTSAVADKLEKQVDKAQGTTKRRSLAEIEADHERQRLIAIDGGKDAGN